MACERLDRQQLVRTCRHSTTTAQTCAVAVTLRSLQGEEYVALTVQTAAPQAPFTVRTVGADVPSYTTSHDCAPWMISMVKVSPFGGGYLADRTLHHHSYLSDEKAHS